MLNTANENAVFSAMITIILLISYMDGILKYMYHVSTDVRMSSEIPFIFCYFYYNVDLMLTHRRRRWLFINLSGLTD